MAVASPRALPKPVRLWDIIAALPPTVAAQRSIAAVALRARLAPMANALPFAFPKLARVWATINAAYGAMVAAKRWTAALARPAKRVPMDNALRIARREQPKNAMKAICIGIILAAYRKSWHKIAATTNLHQITAVRAIKSNAKYSGGDVRRTLVLPLRIGRTLSIVPTTKFAAAAIASLPRTALKPNHRPLRTRLKKLIRDLE